MRLHELTSIRKKSKRVARGGKRGTTAGRGTKGQRSRAGHRIRPAERDLILRMPKRRGFRNKPVTPKPLVIQLAALEVILASASADIRKAVNLQALKDLKLVPRKYQGSVKVLGRGKGAAAFTLVGLKVSKESAAAVQKAGGKVE